MAIHEPPESESASRPDARSVRRLLERVYGEGELHHVDDLVAPDYVGRWAGTDDVAVGPPGLKAHAARFRAALGGVSLDIDAVETAGASFEARWSVRGRLERPLLGVEPSCVVDAAGTEPHGPAVTLSAVSRGVVRAGELVETETAWTLEGPDIDASSPAGGSTVGRSPSQAVPIASPPATVPGR